MRTGYISLNVTNNLFKGLTNLLKSLYSKPASAFGTSIVLIFVLLALIGSVLAPYDANQQFYENARQSPSIEYWFGTDNLGRDIFSRVILGARDILALAGVGTLLAMVIGTFIGLLSAYKGGWADELLMRALDGVLAIPAMLLALMLLGSLGPSRNSVLFVIVIVYIPIIARVTRSVVLTIKTRGFVEAAIIQGESERFILVKEILPSALPALAVEGALRFSYAIFLVASLGYLGLGVQPPSPDWGLMVKEARVNFSQTPWALYYPAGAVALLVVGINLAADGLKRYLQGSE